MANTAYSVFQTNVLRNLAMNQTDATAVVKATINTAHRLISQAHDFDELLVTDITSADTVADQKSYHITTHLGLTRPKHIYSIRYIDAANSRKLIYKEQSKWDEEVPYPEQWVTGRPTTYTRFGQTLELNPIPDDAKDLYIRHSQWPTVLSADADETDYERLDDLIEALATALAFAAFEEGDSSGLWFNIAKSIYDSVIGDKQIGPDRHWKVEALDVSKTGLRVIDDYWANPFIKEQL